MRTNFVISSEISYWIRKTSNCFIELIKDGWDTGTEIESGYLIQDTTEIYSNTVLSNKTEPKDVKILV